jgi:tRNA pseudouridine38-40 synthase
MKKSRRESRSDSSTGGGSRRLRLDLGFTGTEFRGWQAQARGTTVQGLVDEALRSIDHSGPRVTGCSRTDSGVHARTFTAHVDTFLRRPLLSILKGLNANLPPQVRVYRAGWPPPDFHARYSCTGKSYRYHLYVGPVVPPPLAPYVWAWQGELDLAAMREGCGLFLGEHDFAAFTTADGRERNTLRTVTRCDWVLDGPVLALHVSGPSFLHRMVRCIGGALVAVGTGRLSPADVERALGGDLSGPQIPALPAQALTLWEVNYPVEMEPAEVAGAWPEGPLFPL